MAAWVLNLDSDYELAKPGYAPRAAVLEKMRPHVETLAARLLGPGDVLVQDGVSAPGQVGRAWSPTPSAIRRLERAGALPAPHPSVDVLRKVTSRAFSAALGQTLPGAVFATTYEDALAALARPGVWRVKRSFGMAGRDQRIVRRASDADLGFVRAALAEGGVQIEPQLEIRRELAIHGFIDHRGDVQFGPLLEQRCDPHGSWTSSTPTDDAACRAPIAHEARRAADALVLAGYFGPFGVDAFVHAEGLQPRSEVNARFTMGFPLGLVPRD